MALMDNARGFDRRAVLAGAAGLFAAGAAVAKPAQTFFKAHNLPVGLQLYTVGAPATADLDGTLKQVADIGYRTVELAGYIGKTPRELRAALDRAGLKCTSAHIGGRKLAPGPSLNDDPAELAEQAHTLGFDTIVMPVFYMPERFDLTPKPGDGLAERIARFTTIAKSMTVDDWRWNADYMNKKAAALKPHGIRVGYHNHNTEFGPIGDTTPMEILLKKTDPKLVQFELDVGWAVAAGQDPVALLKAHPGRFTAFHVKDVKATTKPNFALSQDPAEVGDGIIDWKRLLPFAYRAGVRRFFVEQEPPFTTPPLEAIRKSFDYLQTVKA